jgi:hypothetical protein
MMTESGIIDSQFIEGKLVIQRLSGTKIKSGPALDKLRNRIDETKAFQNWLFKASIEQIKKIRA